MSTKVADANGATTPKIRLRGLAKAFGPKVVLDGVDLDIRAGHSMVILGGSGSGKSVTLKCILGLIAPDSGSIEIDGRDLSRLSRREREGVNDRIGMLFQNGALFDSLPVWENVCFKLLAQRRITRRAARDKAAEVLAQVGLAASVGDLSPSELSGGMQKRVGLARAIIMEPEVVLFDEPNSGLDPITSASGRFPSPNVSTNASPPVTLPFRSITTRSPGRGTSPPPTRIS